MKGLQGGPEGSASPQEELREAGSGVSEPSRGCQAAGGRQRALSPRCTAAHRPNPPRPLCPWPGAQLHHSPPQAPGSASPYTGQELACARSSCEVRVAPKTSQERVPSPPSVPAGLCVSGEGTGTHSPFHAGRERWLGARQGVMSKPCRAYASLSAQLSHAGLGDATFAQMPPSQSADGSASSPGWGELVWVWLVNTTPQFSFIFGLAVINMRGSSFR